MIRSGALDEGTLAVVFHSCAEQSEAGLVITKTRFGEVPLKISTLYFLLSCSTPENSHDNLLFCLVYTEARRGSQLLIIFRRGCC